MKIPKKCWYCGETHFTVTRHKDRHQFYLCTNCNASDTGISESKVIPIKVKRFEIISSERRW